MKLRYYLRGLGIGIFVTALIMGVTVKSHPQKMSESEIRAEAAKLGMVDGRNVLQETTEQSEQSDMEVAEQLCQSFGSTYVVTENLMDVFGAIGGASPAFAFLYMEALADGAVANGMPRQMAYEIAAQATMGAAKLMKESKKHPGELKDMVCSPGGTTIEGVSALEKNGLRAGVIEAIRACVEKSRKL